jgi:hypothetical protein
VKKFAYYLKEAQYGEDQFGFPNVKFDLEKKEIDQSIDLVWDSIDGEFKNTKYSEGVGGDGSKMKKKKRKIEKKIDTIRELLEYELKFFAHQCVRNFNSFHCSTLHLETSYKFFFIEYKKTGMKFSDGTDTEFFSFDELIKLNPAYKELNIIKYRSPILGGFNIFYLIYFSAVSYIAFFILSDSIGAMILTLLFSILIVLPIIMMQLDFSDYDDIPEIYKKPLLSALISDLFSIVWTGISFLVELVYLEIRNIFKFKSISNIAENMKKEKQRVIADIRKDYQV